jgi:hypothetical protein
MGDGRVGGEQEFFGLYVNCGGGCWLWHYAFGDWTEIVTATATSSEPYEVIHSSAIRSIFCRAEMIGFEFGQLQ